MDATTHGMDSFASERRKAYVRRIVDQAPPLTPDRFSYLASLFQQPAAK